MEHINQSILDERLALRKTWYLSERFKKSPNITECCSVSVHHRISYAPKDRQTLPLIRASFLWAYDYVTKWFGCRNDISIDLWVAPHVVDLQFMTCLPCEEGFFCAPGNRHGTRVILFVSPLFCKRNADKDCLSGLLVHEITHHLVREISHATPLSMKRKETSDVPMWLEEGLCQLIQGEVYLPFKQKCATEIAATPKWYNTSDLWNDLSSCDDPKTAYLQAYKKVGTLMKTKGKREIIRLLYLNRTNEADWNDLY